MRNTKLVELLKNLSRRECTRFEEFVYSPFFNKNVKTRKLCTLLLKHGPSYDHLALEKQKIYRHLFGKDVFNEYRINNVISDLLQLLYRFLAQLKIEEEPVKEREFLLEALLDRELHAHVERNARRMSQLQEKISHKSYSYFLQQYQLEDKLDIFSLTQGKRAFDEHLQRKSDMLDRFYFCNKLRIACDMTSRNTVVNATYECHFLKELLYHYEANTENIGVLPVLQVYYAAFQMLQTEAEEAHYYQLKNLLQEHLHLFPQAELRVLYNFALNFCVKKINSGLTTYYREILDVYKVLLEEQILFKNGYLTQWSYINIVTAGIRLKEYDWTERFIYDYKSQLLPENQQNVFTYSLSSLYFERQLFHKALQELQGVEFTDAFYHMAAKIIQLKSYYELGETEAFLALVEATKKYLQRNRQLSDYQLRSNRNFLKLLAGLYQLRLRSKTDSKAVFQKNVKELQEHLQATTPVSNKGWLIQAVSGLV